jgi:D-alanyl-D-alanine carboxypeptidase
MKRKALYFSVMFICLAYLQACKKKEANSEKSPVEALQKILENNWSPYSQQFDQQNIGVALYVKTKDHSYFTTYGFTQEFTEKSRFRGASTTKSFTGAAILKLYQEGKLDIDDFLSDTIPGTQKTYLPNTPEYAIPNKSAITIRMLLEHRAGVFDVTNNPIPSDVSAPYAGKYYVDYILSLHGGHYDFSKTELLKPVVENQLQFFAPDSAFHYSNTGFGLLGLIVENVSGMPLDQYQKKYLIDPLNLSNSYMATTEALSQVPDPKVDYYVLIDQDMITNLFDNLSSAQADGNIITSIEDLGNWSYHLWGTNDVLNANTLKEMTTMIPTGEEHEFYGLACEGGPAEIGYGHNGARIGTMVIMRFDPKSKCSYTLVTNFLNGNDLLSEGAVENEIVKEAEALFQQKQL